MPPKKRKVLASKATTTAAAAKKRASKTAKSGPRSSTGKGHAAQRPRATRASRKASKAATHRASVLEVATTTVASKTKRQVQTPSSTSSNSHRNTCASSPQSPKPSRSRQAAAQTPAKGPVRRRSTSALAATTKAAAPTTLAPVTRPRRDTATAKPPPRENKELNEGCAAKGKTKRTENKNGAREGGDAAAASPPSRSTVQTSMVTTTRATQPITVVTTDGDSEEGVSDIEDTLLFCSDVDITDVVHTAGCNDGARQTHRGASSTSPHRSRTASAATGVERCLLKSSKASPTSTLPLLRRESASRESSSATLDLCHCTASPPPSLQPTHDSLSRHSAESSPEALTGDSESKRRSHWWQKQFLTGGTPATQSLRGEGERALLQDDSNERAGIPSPHAAQTVKRLFVKPTRSLTPTSPNNSPNDTLIMGPGSEVDGVGEKDAQGPRRRQQRHHDILSTPIDSSSATTSSTSQSWWSLGTSSDALPPPPGSAGAIPPSPPPSPESRPSTAVGTGAPSCWASASPVSTQSMAVKDNDVSASRHPEAVAPTMQPFPAPAGHLRMSGNTSRQCSPSSSASPYSWLKRTVGRGVGEVSHSAAPTQSMASPPSAANTLLQQQWPAYAYRHLGPTTSLSSPLSQLADMEMMMNADAGAEGGHDLTGATPQQPRLREPPPVWRSPQASQLPRSLSVSPASLRGEGCGSIVRSDNTSFLSQPLQQTPPAAPSAFPIHSMPGEATQTFIQAPTNAAASGPQASLHNVPSGSAAALAAGRPSTQLIRKAAATRPLASPGTMWIYLDDDDNSEGGDDGGGNTPTGAPLNDGTDFTAVSVKRERDADAEEGVLGAVWTPLGRGAPAGASSSPARLLQDGGMALGDEEATQVHGKLRSRPPSLEKANSSGADPRVDESGIPASTPSGHVRRKPQAESTYPIAEILSPTFRPRRRPVETSGDTIPVAGARGAFCQWPSSIEPAPHCYINMDDETEEDDGEADEAPPRQRARESPARAAVPTAAKPLHASSVRGAQMHGQLSLPLIIDDDDDDDVDDSDVAGTREGDGEAHKGECGAPQHKRQRSIRVEGTNKAVAKEGGDHDELLQSPQKPHVKDFIFPNRLDPERRPSSPLYQSIHAYQRQYQQQQQQQQQQQWSQGKSTKEPAERYAAADTPELLQGDLTADGHRLARNAGAREEVRRDTREASTWIMTDEVSQAGQKRGRAGDAEREAAVSAPALPDWGRPADTLLRDFFPTKFTKKSFMQAAKNVMSPMHFLEAGDFWAAFTSVEFVGEGSFGLVWRCLTVDGDLVAVKSCPIILRTKANIEDSFSTIREIATMRFLNEMQVPYVLPLHSAFFVHEREALPPLAQEALEWRRQLRKKAEDAALEVEVKLLGRGGHRRALHTPTEGDAEDAPLTLEQQVAAQMERLAAEEGPEEQATRARLQSVRLPRFLSISHDDLIQSDATAFLVMELCDGDLEGIARSDGIAKGVVYCVSTALAAMHELGLLHLDLKPSNILFAFEHGPSQQRPQQSSTPGNATNAVKFYLSDFGNCRLVGPDPMAEVQESYGTFEYMDLRALRDAVCGRPTDAFSLGATLYELLYGKRLYPKCVNPRCRNEEDHSRECYVEAASQPVALPTLGPLAATAVVAPVPTVGLDVPADGHTHGRHAHGGTSGNSSSTLTPLQCLTLALLQQSWSERMTAEECRCYLVQTFHITQTETLIP
ncbi:hypothetical protein JKF63_07643 [Porcisia hertigi]|uniref:Protein kinase domain-containing protein n=1 Tax=Porcisia hertigi TaxID=2761500 RepID=A0A836IQI0_9TRYP|nr:hypothetical protein JKF63_07643 [Porcisia hertigi]